MLARLAWILAGVSIVLVIADVLVSMQSVTLTSETAVAVHGFPLVHGATVGASLMGALIVSRYERHPIGWLLSVVGIVGAISLVTEAFAFWSQEADGPGPAALGSVAAYVAQVLGGQLIIGGLTLMFLLAPDGHLLTRRWRYAVWANVLGVSLCFLAVVSQDPTTYSLAHQEDNLDPVRIAMLSFGFLTITGCLIAAVVSVVLRLRRSSGPLRDQLKIIALSAALPAFGIAWLAVVQGVNGGQQTWLASLPLYIGYFLLPILFAVAVLRYRLYDLDLIINRTLVLVAGTMFAALGYTLLVVTVGEAVEGRAGGFGLSLIAIAAVALAFQPLRRRVIRLSNRLAFGERAQPYEALAGFSRQLAESPTPENLLDAVAEAAARAVSARGVTATLEAPGVDPVAATWGTVVTPPDHVVPVRNDGVDLGHLAVTSGRGGLRPSDVRLLQALADQTAVAFRNTALSAQLAAHVTDLDRATRELADSRLRIIEADDAARRVLEEAIARDVLPYLESLPDELHRARESVAAGAADPGLVRLVGGTNEALEALRDLTRGVFPSQLARAGLEPALRTLLTRSGVSATLTLDGAAGRRFSPRVEAAVYFCCVEAARAGAGLTAIGLDLEEADLVLRLSGREGSDVDLQAVTDRVEAVGGSVRTGPGSLVLTIPVETAEESALVGGPLGRGPGL